jgi:glycosyltransferase involved in cell wall biosynthesis
MGKKLKPRRREPENIFLGKIQFNKRQKSFFWFHKIEKATMLSNRILSLKQQKLNSIFYYLRAKSLSFFFLIKNMLRKKNVFNPTINILIRTSNRPLFFNQCIQSIKNQTYGKINYLISVDNWADEKYVKPEKYHYMEKLPKEEKWSIFDGIKVGHAPYNLYLNKLMSHVSEGWIMYLDDDDMLSDPNSISQIVKHIRTEDDLILWRVGFPKGAVVPNHQNFGHVPKCFNISTIGFLFHLKYVPFAKWDEYGCSDYRVAARLYKVIPNKVWINKVFTKLQREDNWGGRGDQLDREEETSAYKPLNCRAKETS